MAVADIHKLVENMKRANALTSRAAEAAPKHAAIMDAFEQRMGLNDENMSKIAEYEKIMSAMDAGGNGGPALVTTFSSDAADKAAPVAAATVTPIHFNTGDPIK